MGRSVEIQPLELRVSLSSNAYSSRRALQVIKMSKPNVEQQSGVQQRSPRLSPEIREFLHMLNALEGQLAEKPAADTAAR